MTDLSTTRVLIIEDNPLVRKLVREALAAVGIRRVVEAQDGEEGLAAVKAGKPDVVLCDIAMAPVDGLEFLRRLRADREPACFTPVIMLTSKGDRENVVEALGHGAAGYLLKPISPKALAERIRMALASRNRDQVSQ